MKKNGFLRRCFCVAVALFTMTGFIPSLTRQSALAAGTDIYVGYPSKSNNYSTVGQAVEACAKLNPASEDSRITVHIAPGIYREQLLINVPYITFVNDEPQNGDVLLTWYYGIGYKYYSVGADGYYSSAAAASKSAKAEPTSRWGCSVYLRSKAAFFRAENIVFEASFNRYVTDEELADGVEPSGSQSITFRRTSNSDVTSKEATERAAAIAIDANRTEFYNCSFLGSQDTLYTGSNTQGYMKNCLVQGNTDYIFGSGDWVWEDCELRFAGYSSQAAGGYITAAREQQLGYLFYNCKITGNPAKVVNTGYFGRPWRATASVTFYNTLLQRESFIHSAGWTSMSGVDPSQAHFREYNTKLENGAGVNTYGRIGGTVLNESQAAQINPESYFGGWTPYFRDYDPFKPAEGAVMDESITCVFRNAASGQYLSTETAAVAAGVNVICAEQSEASAWTLKAAGDGYYYILSANGNGSFFLDLDYGKAEDGTNIGIYTDTNSDAQLFKFINNGDGTYLIATKATNDRSVIEPSAENANVRQWSVSGEKSQSWYVGEYSPAPTLTAEDILGIKRFVHGVSDASPENGDYDGDGAFTAADTAIAKRVFIS